MTMVGDHAGAGWVTVCCLDAILPDSGVCALVAGRQVAVFRYGESMLFALANRDPSSGANVLSRGLVGDARGVPKVTSPITKHAFALETGVSLTDPTLRTRVVPVRSVGGFVQVATPASELRQRGPSPAGVSS